MRKGVLNMYFLFKHEGLRNLSLGIPKMMKECQFAYVSCQSVVKVRRKTALRGCHLLLSAI